MSRRKRRGVTVTTPPAGAPATNGHHPPAPTKATQLPYRRERDTLGVLRVDGHEVVAVEPYTGSDGRPLETFERLLLDDGRELLGCTKCSAVGEQPRSLASHHRSHAVRYSDPRVHAAVEKAVRRAVERATAGRDREPTPEEIDESLRSGPIREELDRIAADSSPRVPVEEVAAALAHEPFPETGGVTPPTLNRVLAEAAGAAPAAVSEPRTIVEIAQDIATVTARLEELKAEMRAAITS